MSSSSATTITGKFSLNPAKFSVPRGSTKRFKLTTKIDDVLLDLTGSKIYATVKERIEDVGFLIRKRNTAAGGSDSEIEILLPQTGAGAVTGQFKLKFVPTDTANLTPDKTYVVDVWVVTAADEHFQVVEPGGFNITYTVTVDFS